MTEDEARAVYEKALDDAAAAYAKAPAAYDNVRAAYERVTDEAWAAYKKAMAPYEKACRDAKKAEAADIARLRLEGRGQERREEHGADSLLR